MARRVAISVARAATDEYMVLSAPASAPNAIAIASGQPSFWIRSEVCDGLFGEVGGLGFHVEFQARIVVVIAP